MKKTLILLLLCCLAGIAQVIPLPPRMDASQPFLGEATAEAIRPLPGTPSAIWHRDEGYLELPLKFQTAGLWRLGWDLPFPADLTTAYGIEFDFYVSESAGLNQANQRIYLRSGKGWYLLPFGVRQPGRWNHVVLGKSFADIEGQPDGWGKVDGLRISLGCFDDPNGEVAAIANLRLCQRHGEVMVISALSYGIANPEATGYKYYAETLAQSLEELGIGYMMVADTEVSADILKDVRVVVLPYNPQLPDGVVKLLKEFVARGGKLLATYGIPSEVATLLGVRLTGWKRCEQGNFLGFLATQDALPRQPSLACQDSSHTNTASLVGEGRVIANWANPDGSDSGLPAALETPTGIYLGHVWFGPFGRDAQPFFLSMMAALAPEVLRQSAENAFEKIGVLNGYDGLEDIQRKISLDASEEAIAALDGAFELQVQAQKCLAAQEWYECRELCTQAQGKAIEALCRVVPAGSADEQRAFWCHSAFGLPGKTWGESIKFLSDNGFNTILVNSAWAGVAFYPSTVLPSYPELASRGDQLRECLDACKKYGVKCHVWVVTWNLGPYRDSEFTRRMNDEHRTQVSFSGRPEPQWLCPSDPQNLQLMVDAMLEVVRNYPEIAGLHFDYIRYPGREHCFCEGCRKHFEERLGRPVENWPADTRSTFKEEWQQFRCDQISALVKLVHDGAKALRPDVEISAAVLKEWPIVREDNGQDWEAWCREGWLDFICPMDYTDAPMTFRGFLQKQGEWAHGVRLCPGIGLSVWKQVNRPLMVIELVGIARQFQLPGFTIFNFDSHAEAVLPLLHLGCTSQ